MKKILGRIIVVLPAVIIQFLWYLFIIGFIDRLTGKHLGTILDLVLSVLAVVFVLSLVKKREESSYKILWIMVITSLPLLGALLYIFLGNKGTGKRIKRRLNASKESLSYELPKDEQAAADIRKEDLRLSQSLDQLSRLTGFSMLSNRSAKYYPFGDDMFKDMRADLENAEKFIFIEYFIIQSGKFWDTLVEILERKATAGVDVRVMYDDLGSISTYSATDVIKLAKKGIKCIPFNPFVLIKSQLNNRDHRKIMSVDGKVCYSGGINLSDEYINAKQPYGIWKDIGFRLTGDAVKSYTYMFVEFWNAFSVDKISKQWLDDIQTDEQDSSDVENENTDGYILPYYDSPLRDQPASNIFYSEILSTATQYVWFYTPYLMLGDDLFNAFLKAASRGVDVRIIMPGIPDKKMVYRLSRSYYGDLIAAGVKIYEYTPGFVHAKAMISDDKIAAIGTVNLDYRSLFLHFECNSVFYKSGIIDDLKADYLSTQEECVERTAEFVKKGFFHNFIDSILRVIAPLL